MHGAQAEVWEWASHNQGATCKDAGAELMKQT